MVHSQKGNEFFDLDYQNTTIDFSLLPLEFIIEKPVQFVSLLFIFLRGKHMGTSFLNLRKGRQVTEKANNLSLWHPANREQPYLGSGLTLVEILPGK